jgi:hypothetical protein
MMLWHALVVVVFLMNGQPVLTGELIPADQECGPDQAKELAEALGVEYQNEILWQCRPVTSPGPVRHVPQMNEANAP